MLKSLLNKLGADPQKSWARFKTGLMLFIAGSVLLFLGARFLIWLQIPAIFLMTGGFIIAARGYVGIFANRFALTLNQLSHRAPVDPSDKQR